MSSRIKMIWDTQCQWCHWCFLCVHLSFPWAPFQFFQDIGHCISCKKYHRLDWRFHRWQQLFFGRPQLKKIPKIFLPSNPRGWIEFKVLGLIPEFIKCCSGIGPSILRDQSLKCILRTHGSLTEPHFLTLGSIPDLDWDFSFSHDKAGIRSGDSTKVL